MDRHIEWHAPEFRYYPKDNNWYWLSLVFAALLFGLALWQKNFLFAVFVIISEFIVLYYGNEFPKTIRFRITERGVEAGERKIYSYDSLESFAVSEEENELSELILTSRSKLAPIVKINVHTREIPEIKNALGEFLPESEYEESFFDAVAKLIRF